MADIFLSYADEDRKAALPVARGLEAKGWSVFWDRKIPTGSTWPEILDEHLEKAGCVVVLWTEAATKSQWVREEADEGRERNILLPVLIEPIKPPRGFRQIQAASLIDWNGNLEHPEFAALCSRIKDLVGMPKADTSVPTDAPSLSSPMAGISLLCPSEQPVDLSGAIGLLGNPHKVRPKDGADDAVRLLWYFSSASSAKKAMSSLQDKLPGAEIEIFYRQA